MKIKVRGIFSTALVKFLIDKGFEVVEPSKLQEKRFGIKNKNLPDVYISDTKDKFGIKVLGFKEDVENLIKEFKSMFWDSFYFKSFETIKEDRKEKIVRYYNTFLKEEKESFVKQIDGLGIGINIKTSTIFSDISLALKDLGIENPYIKKNPYIYDRSSLLEFFKKIKEKSIVCYNIIFGEESHKTLDKLRSEVTSTIKDHHWYRKSSLFSKFVDLLEFLKESGYEIENILKEYSIKMCKDKGYILRNHFKLFNGFKVKEKIQEIKEWEIVTKRTVKSNGKYDGLEIEKKRGDIIVTKYPIEKNYIITKYFRDGKKIGEYVNINSSLKIIGNRVYYIDYEVDIVKTNEEYKVIDLDILDMYKDLGIITKKFYDMIKTMVDEILENLKSETD